MMLILAITFSAFLYGPSSPQAEYEPPPPAPVIDYPFGITDKVLLSFMWYESRYNTAAEQTVTKARGVLQILPVMIAEANRLRQRQGSDRRYTWEDAWCVDSSVEIWYLVQQYHNPDYDLALACQVWFGRGVQYDGKTWREYHRDVEQYLATIP